MGVGHPAVVAVEEGEQVLRQITLVDGAERAHNAEVDRAVLAAWRDEDVARMHVGVEEAVAKRLSEKYLDSVVREFFAVDAGRVNLIDAANRNAVDPLHHHHIAPGVLPINFRHMD